MKGILFTEPLFYNVVSGEKTQTRRIIKPHPDFISENFHWAKKNNGEVILPRYGCNDKLYLKEPYKIKHLQLSSFEIELKYTQRSHLYFFNKFDKPIDIISWVNKRWVEQIKSKTGYCNKLFMPEFCAKNFIEITGVRCERLQDISDEDCIKEGVYETRDINNVICYTCEEKDPYIYISYKRAYAALINAISGKGTWESNLFVWVYDFKLTNKDINI
jgi:hypothetical protein